MHRDNTASCKSTKLLMHYVSYDKITLYRRWNPVKSDDFASNWTWHKAHSLNDWALVASLSRVGKPVIRSPRHWRNGEYRKLEESRPLSEKAARLGDQSAIIVPPKKLGLLACRMVPFSDLVFSHLLASHRKRTASNLFKAQQKCILFSQKR